MKHIIALVGIYFTLIFLEQEIGLVDAGEILKHLKGNHSFSLTSNNVNNPLPPIFFFQFLLLFCVKHKKC